MKTTLIQLEEHDDILSIKDKMQWNPSKRILLIVPHNNKSIHRRLDLVLLQRAARKNGAQLAMASSQKYLHGLAKITGLPVFSTVLAAQKQDWPESAEKISKPQSPGTNEIKKLKETISNEKKERVIPNWQKILFFILGTLAPIALVLVVIPRATVTLLPSLTAQKLTLDFSASPAYISVSIDGRIPAYSRSITLSTAGVIPTTGETSIPDQFSTGSVRITNLSDVAMNLPAHYKISVENSSSLHFQTAAAAYIPAGKGQFVDVPIMALTAGTAGNLPPLSINFIEGPYSSMLQVTNLTSITGGSEIHVKAVSGEDIQLLDSQLSQELQSEALAQIKNSASSNEIFILGTMKVVNETFISNLAIGDPGDQLTMEIKGNYQFLVIYKNDIKQLVTIYAAISIPPGSQQFADSLHYNDPVITSFQDEIQLIKGRIDITQNFQVSIDKNQLINEILGKTEKEALNIIQSKLSLIQPPKIELFPSFWFWMPLIPGQIILENPGVQ